MQPDTAVEQLMDALFQLKQSIDNASSALLTILTEIDKSIEGIGSAIDARP